jgi:hypothetical protein
MNLIQRYHEKLHGLQPPGSGAYHSTILSIANIAATAGISPYQTVDDIRRHTNPGSRRLTPREIEDAVAKAYRDIGSGFKPRQRPDPPVKDMAAALQKIIRRGGIKTEVDLWEASPIRLWDDPEKDPVLFLTSLYSPEDYLFIGDRYDGKTVKQIKQWIEHFNHEGKPDPHFCINPLTGQPTQTGDKETWRGDANVKDFRYVLVEFDNIPKEDQIGFWSGSGLPVCCLIDSAGKSIHGLLDAAQMAKVETLDQWRSEIKSRLFNDLLTPMGCDGASSNPARLSRFPGHNREGKGMQRILWLAGRKGRPVL